VDHVLPIAHAIGVVDHLAYVIEAGAVCEHLTDRDLGLSGLREFRPVFRDPIVVVEPSLVSQDVEHGRCDALGRRKAGRHRVLEPGPGLVPRTTPQVHHALAAVVDTDGGSSFRVPELRPELIGDPGEIRVQPASEIHGLPVTLEPIGDPPRVLPPAPNPRLLRRVHDDFPPRPS